MTSLHSKLQFVKRKFFRIRNLLEKTLAPETKVIKKRMKSELSNPRFMVLPMERIISDNYLQTNRVTLAGSKLPTGVGIQDMVLEASDEKTLIVVYNESLLAHLIERTRKHPERFDNKQTFVTVRNLDTNTRGYLLDTYSTVFVLDSQATIARIGGMATFLKNVAGVCHHDVIIHLL